MTGYILTRSPDLVVDEAIVANHKWQTTITWASEAERTNPDLLAEKLLVEESMVTSGRLYAPPRLLDAVTAVRVFPTEADAQFWISSIQDLATKHNSGIVSAVVTELP